MQLHWLRLREEQRSDQQQQYEREKFGKWHYKLLDAFADQARLGVRTSAMV